MSQRQVSNFSIVDTDHDDSASTSSSLKRGSKDPRKRKIEGKILDDPYGHGNSPQQRPEKRRNGGKHLWRLVKTAKFYFS
ncbi:Bromodomain Adjacent To Zinc Finger Domain Protein 2B [Manis pentadactyla]|nr:Bromodomain Adjacent To Zinc Finger Domain Protein 2B [Manis pentadactyla]